MDNRKATEMKEYSLDSELEKIHRHFSFLWEKHGFRTAYLTGDHGLYDGGFVIGLENSLCKLVFEKETDSPVESISINIGKKLSTITPPNHSCRGMYGWHALTGLTYWIGGVECKRDRNVDRDLEYVSQSLKLHIDKVLDLFRHPAEFDRKLEQYQTLNKDDRITVERGREGRARLQSLGQDSSLEAAVASLRGGGK